MRARFTILLSATLTVALSGSAPALAKGDREERPAAVVTISGPALDAPILLNGDVVWHVLYLSTFRGYNVMPAEAPARGRLGPALEASYRFVLTDGKVQTLRQMLYPCAADGKTWAFTGSGQDAVRNRIGSPVESGWWHSTALAGVVEGLRSACGGSAAIATGAVGTGGIGSGAWIVLLALALAATIGLLRLGRSRRRQPIRT